MAAFHEGTHGRVVTTVPQLPRRAPGDGSPALGIEKDAVVADRKQARQLVGHDHDSCAKTAAELEDQVVQPVGGDGIEAGRRLVEEQDIGIECERPRQGSALAHAAGEFGRHLVRRPGQPDQRQLEVHEHADRRRVERGEHLQGERDVLADRHRAPQGAALEQHAEASANVDAALLAGRPVVRTVDQDRSGGRRQQSDHRLEHGALAASAAAHDGEDGARTYREAKIALDDVRPEGNGQIAHFQPVGGIGVAGHRFRSRAHWCRPRKRRRGR